jgi:hypothetical protein
MRTTTQTPASCGGSSEAHAAGLGFRECTQEADDLNSKTLRKKTNNNSIEEIEQEETEETEYSGTLFSPFPPVQKCISFNLSIFARIDAAKHPAG